jgi:hypothetical protein
MWDRQCFSLGAKVGNDDSFSGIFVFLKQKLKYWVLLSRYLKAAKHLSCISAQNVGRWSFLHLCNLF